MIHDSMYLVRTYVVEYLLEIDTVGNPNGVLEVSVGNPNGVPEVSHVISNVAERDAVSKEQFSRSSTVSFSLDSPIGGVSTVHNHRSSTVQFSCKILYTWLE